MKVKTLSIRITTFFLIGLMLFNTIQSILTPNWSLENTDRIISGFDALEENTIDVLYLGTSHMEYGMSPMKLYEDTNICSYSLATSGQPIGCSYYLLKKAFETQAPSVVMLDVSNLFHADSLVVHSFWRYILDNLNLGILKLEMANDYDKQLNSDGKWAALLPIIKYHTRWKELSAQDVNSADTDFYYSAGEFAYSQVIGSPWNLEDIDLVSNDMMLQTKGTLKYIDGCEITKEEFYSLLYAPTISERNLTWLKKIKNLCSEHDAQLILTKVPVRAYPQFYTGAWTSEKSKLVQGISDKLDIPFLDLQYHVDVGLDYSSDTWDEGAHLNFRGAEKVATTVGAYLVEHFELRQQNNSKYDKALTKYQKIRDIAVLQSETDFATYLEILAKHKAQWIIVIAARDEYTHGMHDADYTLLDNLGLQLIQQGGYRDAYLAVVDQGNVEYEALSNRRIDHTIISGDLSIMLSSSGWHTTPLSQIEIENVEYSNGARGLNIVIYDNESEQVIDSVTFDTFQQDKPASRNWANINNYLRSYEAKICFN